MAVEPTRLRPEPEPDPRSIYLDVQQVADLLGWPKTRVYRYAKAGILPHYKQGVKLVFHRDELLAGRSAYTLPAPKEPELPDVLARLLRGEAMKVEVTIRLVEASRR